MTSFGNQTTSLVLSVPPGTELNGMYRIDEPIALGGMAEVYRGHNIQTNDPVAIKIVMQEYAQDEMILGLFRKEAQILFRLTDEAIVRYYGISHDPDIGRPYLAMEYVDGLPLTQRMKEGPLDPDSVHVLRRRLATGLQKAHELGVIHRDISPDNIILPENRVDKAKIIDFGIARASGIGDGTLLGGHFAGKYNYVSPEQLGLFGGDVTPRADIYSLGLVLAGALLGESIDMNGNQVEVIEKRRQIPDLSRIDAGSRGIIEAMLQPDPAHRPQLMSDVAAWPVAGEMPMAAPANDFAGSTRVERLPHVSEQPAVAPGRPAPVPRREKPKSKGRGLAVASTFLVATLLAGGFAGWYYFVNNRDKISFPKTAVLTPTAKDKLPETKTEPEPQGQENTGKPVTPEQTGEPALPGSVGKSAIDAPIPSTSATPSQTKSVAKELQPPKKVTSGGQVKKAVSVLDFVTQYDGGDCFYAVVSDLGNKSASIVGFGVARAPFDKFSRDFETANGFDADIQLRVISQAQCVVFDNLQRLRTNPGEAIGLLLDRDLISASQPLQGRLANLKGRNIALLLIDNDGFAYNLATHLKREGSGRGFKIYLNAKKLSTPKPQLILTLATTRPLKSLDTQKPELAARLLSKVINELSATGQKVSTAVKYFKLGG